jgi:hypothetical protein
MQDFLSRFKQKFVQSFTVFLCPVSGFFVHLVVLPFHSHPVSPVPMRWEAKADGTAPVTPSSFFESYIAMKMLANFPPP